MKLRDLLLELFDKLLPE